MPNKKNNNVCSNNINLNQYSNQKYGHTIIKEKKKESWQHPHLQLQEEEEEEDFFVEVCVACKNLCLAID